MRKRSIWQVLLFNSFLIACVPGVATSAFDSPAPLPVSFALASQISFPEYLIEPTTGRWSLHVGGARLFGLPEIQPLQFCAFGNALGGRLRFRGYGLKSGTYAENAFGGEFQHKLAPTLQGSLEIQALQVSIRDYGSAFSGQVNGRLEWSLPNQFDLAFTWINLNGAHFGEGNYALPTRMALGGHFHPFPSMDLFLEIEKESRFSVTSRVGAGFQPIKGIWCLAGFQNEPNLGSLGFSAMIGSFRATAAYQYHTDLGFSQCYGIGVQF